MVSKENLPKRNLTSSGNLFWMHCKYTNMKTKYTYIPVYINIQFEENVGQFNSVTNYIFCDNLSKFQSITTNNCIKLLVPEKLFRAFVAKSNKKK